MTLLGVDPGSHRCGWAILANGGATLRLVEHGCFDYPARSEASARLMKLEVDTMALLKKYKPSFVAIETLFFNQNITTAMHVAEARGVILLTAAKYATPTVDCSPLQVKMAITGYGRAEKADIKQMIQRQFKQVDLHRLDDAVDAIAVALTGAALWQNQNMARS